MENKIIVIATHQRQAITAANIKSLQPHAVVLVITDPYERECYEYLDNAIIVEESNQPLGKKWQAGIEVARKIPHSHIIITGSDDILSKDYIDRACSVQMDFVGLRQWYILHDRNLHHLQYKATGNLPLGGGRVYSRSFLEKINYQLFDIRRQKLLDDLGWMYACRSRYQLINEPKILAVKGNWPVMNKVDLSHPNIQLIKTCKGDEAYKIIKENFDYEPNGLL